MTALHFLKKKKTGLVFVYAAFCVYVWMASSGVLVKYIKINDFISIIDCILQNLSNFN